ncbi:MAG: LEPR-XLL domain-containing protein [Pirellulaceae bacterium]
MNNLQSRSIRKRHRLIGQTWEKLEPRLLLAGDLRNPYQPLDANLTRRLPNRMLWR